MTNTKDKPVKADHQAGNAATAENQLPATDKDKDGNQEESEKHQTEHGGPKGLEPTRYGDWERNGRCTDF